MRKRNFQPDFSALDFNEQPKNVTELINKYGTYEIQPTADTDNKYPTISQGIAKKRKNHGKIFKD